MSGGFSPKDYYDELDESKSQVVKMTKTKKTTDVTESKSETTSVNKPPLRT